MAVTAKISTMKIKVLSISILDPKPGEEELNHFIASHQIVSIDKEFARFEQNAFWSFSINYLEEQQSSSTKRSQVDYKEVLNDEDFSRYAQVRELRNSLAKKEGRPAYSIFTNEQLAKLVTDRVTTKVAMAAISGIGDSRITRYADQFLPLLLRINSGNDQ